MNSMRFNLGPLLCEAAMCIDCAHASKYAPYSSCNWEGLVLNSHWNCSVTLIRILPLLWLCVPCAVLSGFSCVRLCNPMHHSLPGFLSMGSSRQEYWGGLPCPPPGDHPDPRTEPVALGRQVLNHQHHLGSPLLI